MNDLLRFLLSFLFYISSSATFSQSFEAINYSQSYTAANAIAPTTASLMKAIDNPVGLYTGCPNIQYNIFTLHDGKIEIPIILSYTASGIKVNEEASWVGLGWNINVGGMITQSAVGCIDLESEYSNLYSTCDDYFPEGSYPSYNLKNYKPYDDSKYSAFFQYGNAGKIQPDVFYYSYPSNAGKFCYDYREGKVCLLDDSKPIVITHSGYIGNIYGYANWTITTEDGTRHFYEGGLASYTADGRNQVISRTANLVATSLPNGLKIYYNYSKKNSHTIYNYSESQNCLVAPASGVEVCSSDGDGRHGKVKQEAMPITIEESLLDSITTDNYSIIFKKSDREDYENGKRLDEIVVRCKHSQWEVADRHFLFEYTYAQSCDSSQYSRGYLGKNHLQHDGYYNADRLSKRLLLKAVYESDEQSHRNNMMSFSYIYPEMLPMKTSLSIDYWGYYNGRHNNCIIPDYNKLYYAQSSEARNMQTDTGDRSCDTVLVKYGMLDSIRYQTGGITAFEYEPHKYASAHPIPPFIDNGDSEKILKTEDLLDRNSSTDKRSVFFTVQDEQKIRVEAVLSRGMWSWKDLSDANCEIVSYTDKTPKLVKRLSFTPKSSDAPYSSALAVVTVLGNGSYGIYINLPDNIGDQSEISSKHASLKATVILYSKKRLSKDLQRKFNIGGGVRVKQVSYFNSLDSKSPSMKYLYEYPDTAGFLQVPLSFEREFHDLYYAQKRYSQTQETNVITTGSGGTELLLCSYNVHSSPYSSFTSCVGYNEVKVIRYDDSKYVKSVYRFSNNQESSANSSFQIASQAKGHLLSEKIFDNKGDLIKSLEYGYTNKRTYQIIGVSMTDFFNRSPEFYQNSKSPMSGYTLVSNDGKLMQYGEYDGRYQTMFYPINSERTLLTSKKIFVDGVTQENEYLYDGHCQLTEIKRKESDGKLHTVSYRYPYEFNAGNVEKNMCSMNMLSYPVEIIEKVNNEITGGQFTKYSCNNNNHTVWPIEIYKLRIPNNGFSDSTSYCNGNVNRVFYPQADIVYKHFDTYGNPISIINNGVETDYIWGYGFQYPIAEIHGATYDAIMGIIGTNPEYFSYSPTPPFAVLSKIKALPSSLVTTYTWKPLSGVKSVTKPNGENITFLYDSFGRLINTIGHSGEIIQKNIYTYRFF